MCIPSTVSVIERIMRHLVTTLKRTFMIESLQGQSVLSVSYLLSGAFTVGHAQITQL